MKRVGLIRVLTTDDDEILNAHGRRIERYVGNLEVVSRCILDHHEGVHDDLTFRTAVPHVVSLAREFYDEGFDAVVVSCAGDPGVVEAGAEVPIPVIGAGRSVAAIALGLGLRIGVLGITDEAPDPVKEVLGSRMVAYAKPHGVEDTLDLMGEGGLAAAMEAGLRLKSLGAEVIGLACTGLSTIDAARPIAAATGLTVVDPVIAEGLVAVCAVNCRRGE